MGATIADNDSEIDIFISKFVNEKYTKPVNLSAFNRADSVGSSDIYVSYNQNGKWSALLPVGAVNTSAREYSPRLTPGGKRLIFTSERGISRIRLS